MAKRTCRVCGKQYEACKAAMKSTGSFRWQEVACSQECGGIYLQRVLESRSKAKQTVEIISPIVVEEPKLEYETQEDFEDYFEEEILEDE